MSTIPKRRKFRYKCAACGKYYVRVPQNHSPKQWIKSFCESQGVNSRLILQPAISEVERTFRRLKRTGRIF